MAPPPPSGSLLLVLSLSTLLSTPSSALKPPNTPSSTPTVLAAIHKLNSKTAFLDTQTAAQRELQLIICQLEASERAIVRDVKLLTHGQTLVQGSSAQFNHRGNPIANLDLPTEITPVLESLQKELLELEKEHSRKTWLYSRLQGKVSGGENELRALAEKVELLVQVQEVMDTRCGTKGGEDEVVTEIREIKKRRGVLMRGRSSVGECARDFDVTDLGCQSMRT